MTRRLRVLSATLGLALAASLVAGASEAQAPTAGSAGVGDPYFPQDGNGGIDVLHYTVRDAYQFGSGRLTGRTRLDVRATQDLRKFNLDFQLDVESVRVDGRRATFRRKGDHELRIKPAVPLAAGERFRVTVRYAGTPARATSQGESNWLADRHEVVTMNEPHMAAWWFPANDHPRDKASFDIYITVPRGKDVVANGTLVGKRHRHGRTTWHWRAVEPMATYLAFFAAGSFETTTVDCHGIVNTTAVSKRTPDPAHRADVRQLADRTCAVLAAYSNVLGPYPFGSIGGVVTSLPVGFALENQTRPTYPGVPGATPALVAHEVAHQWFGDSVSLDRWRDIWVNEGFAQFLQTWYLTEVTGGRSMQDWLVSTYDGLAASDAFWTVRIGDPGPRDLFHPAVYVRGAMAVQALRHRIGDPAFWNLLRTWVTTRRHGTGSVADFAALAASVSGQDLTAFFDAWLHQPVPPTKNAANGF